MRWVTTENVVSARPGRKISEDFEMPSTIEKNDEQKIVLKIIINVLF
jgi:hypothetical protein